MVHFLAQGEFINNRVNRKGGLTSLDTVSYTIILFNGRKIESVPNMHSLDIVLAKFVVNCPATDSQQFCRLGAVVVSCRERLENHFLFNLF